MATHSSILAGESHGHRSLVGYGPWCHKESDNSYMYIYIHTYIHRQTHTHTHIYIYTHQHVYITVLHLLNDLKIAITIIFAMM